MHSAAQGDTDVRNNSENSSASRLISGLRKKSNQFYDWIVFRAIFHQCHQFGTDFVSTDCGKSQEVVTISAKKFLQGLSRQRPVLLEYSVRECSFYADIYVLLVRQRGGNQGSFCLERDFHNFV
jgi:hypothetical protein